MAGQAMFRNVMGWAKGYFLAIIVQDIAHHLFGIRLPAWLTSADQQASRVLILAFGVLGAWNLLAEARDMPSRLGAWRAEHRLERKRRQDEEARLIAEHLAKRDAAARAGEVLQAVLAQNMVSMQAVHSAWQGGLRYLGPPAIGTGPMRRVPEYELIAVRTLDGTTGHSVLARRDMPDSSENAVLCGKCGQPLARHSYYGNGPCVIACRAPGGYAGQ